MSKSPGSAAEEWDRSSGRRPDGSICTSLTCGAIVTSRRCSCGGISWLNTNRRFWDHSGTSSSRFSPPSSSLSSLGRWLSFPRTVCRRCSSIWRVSPAGRYFADCVNRTSFTFIGNAALFGKVYFPRLSIPLSHVISSMIKFAIQLALFLAFLIFYWMQGAPVQPTAAIALTPLLLLLMAGLSLGAGIIVSALTTRYRDLQQLVALRRSADDVCDARRLSTLNDWRRQFPLAHPGKPNDADRRDLPLRLSRQRHVRRDLSLLQRRLHPGGSVYRRCSFQSRRAHLHGHGLRRKQKAESRKMSRKQMESGRKWKA